MSDMKINLTQGLYAAYARREFEVLLAAMTADVEWYSGGRKEDFPVMGPRKGTAQVREFFLMVAELLEFSEFVPDEFYTDKDKVIVLGHYAMTLRKNGRKVASDWVHIFTFKDGKVTKFREFLDTAALADAYRA